MPLFLYLERNHPMEKILNEILNKINIIQSDIQEIKNTKDTAPIIPIPPDETHRKDIKKTSKNTSLARKHNKLYSDLLYECFNINLDKATLNYDELEFQGVLENAIKEYYSLEKYKNISKNTIINHLDNEISDIKNKITICHSSSNLFLPLLTTFTSIIALCSLGVSTLAFQATANFKVSDLLWNAWQSDKYLKETGIKIGIKDITEHTELTTKAIGASTASTTNTLLIIAYVVIILGVGATYYVMRSQSNSKKYTTKLNFYNLCKKIIENASPPQL